jgi:hypothetical protein
MIRVVGFAQLRANVKKLARTFPERVAAALYAEGNIEMTEAKRRTPVATGELRASGFVSIPLVYGNLIQVELSFGGPAAPYAIYVHEDLEAFHNKVGEAKFLESTLKESAPYLMDRVARRCRV